MHFTNHLLDFNDHFYDFKGPSNTSCLWSQWEEQNSFELFALRASLTVLLNPAKSSNNARYNRTGGPTAADLTRLMILECGQLHPGPNTLTI